MEQRLGTSYGIETRNKLATENKLWNGDWEQAMERRLSYGIETRIKLATENKLWIQCGNEGGQCRLQCHQFPVFTFPVMSEKQEDRK